MKILIIEDKVEVQEMYARRLAGKVTIVAGHTLAEAQRAWRENPDADLIAVDGCLNDWDILDTLELVQQIRQTFHGPMIAASSSRPYRHLPIEAGCSHEARKSEVPSLVTHLLCPETVAVQ